MDKEFKQTIKRRAINVDGKVGLFQFWFGMRLQMSRTIRKVPTSPQGLNAGPLIQDLLKEYLVIHLPPVCESEGDRAAGLGWAVAGQDRRSLQAKTNRRKIHRLPAPCAALPCLSLVPPQSPLKGQ